MNIAPPILVHCILRRLAKWLAKNLVITTLLTKVLPKKEGRYRIKICPYIYYTHMYI